MKSENRSKESFKDGYNCCQAVIATFGPQLGMDKTSCLKIGSGFGGGIGRTGRICGAVSGAYMALSLYAGNKKSDKHEQKEAAYNLINSFDRKFKDYFGSLDCKELLKIDISTTEGRKEAANRKLFDTLCPAFVGKASAILDEMFQQDRS